MKEENVKISKIHYMAFYYHYYFLIHVTQLFSLVKMTCFKIIVISFVNV